jgi:hypothetical protein
MWDMQRLRRLPCTPESSTCVCSLCRIQSSCDCEFWPHCEQLLGTVCYCPCRKSDELSHIYWISFLILFSHRKRNVPQFSPPKSSQPSWHVHVVLVVIALRILDVNFVRHLLLNADKIVSWKKNFDLHWRPSFPCRQLVQCHHRPVWSVFLYLIVHK